ncbi:tRNA pseudouridine(55) synthase TruB [Clostridiaceae bacterium OttesenSCG-928-D20]|nr:tRNA pseudouridine(55) synthase TruB [Clostridiaceae bacterium OttesenSCG-928-D20]
MKGIILIDKPEGWTSHDVCAKLRGALREKRIGHAGTLDPMATGLLTVFVGRATRAVQFAENDIKKYTAGLKLGIKTDTLDTTGSVLDRKPASFSLDEVRKTLEGFKGELLQTPPMYSAIKIQGKKLYEIARRGEEIERAPRKITIYELEAKGDGDEFTLNVTCSKGTYIRSLCDDIGAALGSFGCMSSLRRTAAGIFDISSAHSLEEVLAEENREKFLLPVDSLFSDRESVIIDEKTEERVRNGNSFPTGLSDGEYRIYSKSSEFLCLARAQGGEMKTVKSFFEV